MSQLILVAKFSKDEILEAYINEVYLGQDANGPVTGFAAASHHYFGCGLSDLGYGQIALLTGMLKGPSRYDPIRNPARARKRWDLVTSIMAEQMLVTEEEAKSALTKEIGIVRKRPRHPVRFLAFVHFVRRQADTEIRKKELPKHGLNIFTSLDPLVQAKVEQAVASGLDTLESRYHLVKGSLETDIVVTSLPEGDLIAMVGGRDFRTSGFNRALLAKRQIGSLIKPAVFLAALEHPNQYHLMTRLDDSIIRIQNDDGTLWAPENFDGINHGKVPLYQALSRSYNAACVRLGMGLGLDRMAATLQKLGIQRDIRLYPSSLLGTMAMSPLEVAGMYQIFASEGLFLPIRAIREIRTREGGRVRPKVKTTVRRHFDPGPVYLLNTILQKVISEGTARSEQNQAIRSFFAAGKTGTTDGLRDSLFAGFTGDCLVVVWVGKDDNSSSGLTGANGAFYIWKEIISRISENAFVPDVPDAVRWVQVDPESGKRVVEADCPEAVLMPFIAEYTPEETISCREVKLNADGDSWLKTLF